MSKKVTVLSGQSLADIALQEYGTLSGMALLVEDNLSVITDTTNVPAGTVLEIRSPLPALEVINKQAVQYLQQNKPATWQG